LACNNINFDLCRFSKNLWEYQQSEWKKGELRMKEDFINGDKFMRHYGKYKDGLGSDRRKDPLSNGIFFSCATDGLGIGDRSGISITPIFLRILNFPFWLRVRFLACLLVLILPFSRESVNITGTKRSWPTYNPCLEIVVDELDDLFKNGFTVTYVDGSSEWFYCYLLFVANDLVAIPRLLGCPHVGHTEHGCTMCKVVGVRAAVSGYPSNVPIKPDAVRHFKEEDKDQYCVHRYKGERITRGRLVELYQEAFSKKDNKMNEYCLSLVGKGVTEARTHEEYMTEGARTVTEIARLHVAAGGGDNKISYPDKTTFPITCPCAFGRLEGFDCAKDCILCTMHWGAHLGGKCVRAFCVRANYYYIYINFIYLFILIFCIYAAQHILDDNKIKFSQACLFPAIISRTHF
jgi:hypothetical protein